jgi:hypothetical protein
MLKSMAEAGGSVKSTANQRLLDGWDIPRPTKNRWVRLSDARKRHIGTATSGEPYALSVAVS